MRLRSTGAGVAAAPQPGRDRPGRRRRLGLLAAVLAVTAACATGQAATPPSGLPTDVDGESGGASLSTVGATAAPRMMPTDEAAAASAPCARTSRGSGWVDAENHLPGDPDWRGAETSGKRPVMGWLDRVSGACGDRVGIHLSGDGQPTPVLVYRIGWYGGAGARLVTTLPPVAAPPQPQPPPDQKAPLFMVQTTWPVSTMFTVGPEWVPGYYLLEVGPPGQRYAMPFVVRDDVGTEPLLFQASVLTYQAYNNFGGYSLYEGHDASNARTDRSRTDSFDRPYEGSGYLCPFWYDIPMVQRIEQDGIDAAYTTDVDVDQRPSQLLRHRALVIGGHSEYWTTRMYDAAEAARDHGVNIAVFGANEVYWHARLDPSPTGADRHVTVYRVLAEDPAAKSNPAAATVEWRQSPLNRPEQQLIGSTYDGLGVVGSFRVLDATSWLFAGTGVKNGDVLHNSVGGEYDRVLGDDPLTPADISVVAAAPILQGRQDTMATMSYYTVPSGAGVFSGGTTYWPCQLRNQCSNMPIDPHTRQVLGTITDTILRTFAAGPAGNQHPAQPLSPPNPQYLISTAASEGDVAVRK